MSALYMFPPSEEPMEDRDLLAGEYVLGVLDPGDAASARLRAEADPALQAAIGAWQTRLAPMAAIRRPGEVALLVAHDAAAAAAALSPPAMTTSTCAEPPSVRVRGEATVRVRGWIRT
jgi:anti-sigma-K factor RskA